MLQFPPAQSQCSKQTNKQADMKSPALNIIPAHTHCDYVSIVRTGYSVLVPCLVISLIYHTTCADSIVHLQHMAPISKLHELVLGEVLPCCGQKYQRRRMVNNRACVARPAVIVRPATTEDVAVAVSFARRNGYHVGSVFIPLLVLYKCTKWWPWLQL